MSSTVLYMSMSLYGFHRRAQRKARTMASATEGTGRTSGPFPARREATVMQPLSGCEA